jgi:cell division protein FtsL
MMRLINFCVIAALVVAAAHVYKIKFDSTSQAQRLAKLRMEIRREHDLLATLRAEWAKLNSPGRIEVLARRHLALRPTETHQVDRLDQLPQRKPELLGPDAQDPIGTVIARPDLFDRLVTGSVPARRR